jgi:hypothetical protein
MLKKYASNNTKYSKIFTYGIFCGGLGGTYNNYISYNQSSHLFHFIREQSKFDDNYYKIYKEVCNIHRPLTNNTFINFTEPLAMCESIFNKSNLTGCFTCGVSSVFSAISFKHLTDNLLLVGLIGGIINSGIKSLLTGYSNGTDFLFGMIASIVGIHFINEQDDYQDDILWNEILENGIP